MAFDLVSRYPGLVSALVMLDAAIVLPDAARPPRRAEVRDRTQRAALSNGHAQVRGDRALPRDR